MFLQNFILFLKFKTMAKNIFLSVWHNWANGDTGANANSTNEAVEVSKIIDQVIKIWIPWVKFIKLPVNIDLRARITRINRRLPWLSEPFALEFHMDSSVNQTAKGASVRYNDNNLFTQWEGKQFLQKYTQVTGLISRHVNSDTTNRHGQLWFVSEVKCASLLIELWFISNPTELKIMRDKAVKWTIEGIKNMINS